MKKTFRAQVRSAGGIRSGRYREDQQFGEPDIVS